MLRRRNTIHPLQHSAELGEPQFKPFPPRTKVTNPFLSVSCDNLDDIVHTSQLELDDACLPADALALTSSAAYTNPFLHHTAAYSIGDSLSHNESTARWDVTYNDDSNSGDHHHDSLKHKLQSQYDGGARRLSLDLFKAPFAWNRRRRATCASSDLKRMMKMDQSIIQNEEVARSTFRFPSNSDVPVLSLQDGSNYHGQDEDGVGVILKSCRYEPEEQGDSDMQDHVAYLERDRKRERPASFNPFLSSDSTDSMTDRDAKHDERADQGHVPNKKDLRQTWAAPEGVETLTTNTPGRRRHSVFSDWSIEDCPRLLAFQNQQRDQLWHEQTSDSQKDLSRSRMSMTRSTTDTVIDQHHDLDFRQHHSHYSAYRPPQSATVSILPSSSSTTNRARRNSVVVGRDIIRQEQSPLQSLHAVETESRSLYHYADSRSHHHHEHDDSSESSPLHDRDSWPRPTSMQSSSFERPWRPRSSLARRESHSYAEDFVKDGGPWDELGGEGEDHCSYAEDIAKVESDDDYGLQAYQDNTVFYSDDHDIRHYYNSMDWQETDTTQDDARCPSTTATALNRSRELLTRRATVAKAKFYRLLRQNQHHSQSQSRGSGGDQADRLDVHSEENVNDEVDEYEDPSRSESSVYSVTSSFRERMRLNTKTKTVLRQVKRRLSAAAKTVISEASKAANNIMPEASKANNNLNPVLRSNPKRRGPSHAAVVVE
ncbi:hypothetical protein BGZ98_004663 [Dissophora globulifera]|nr:hypothetical protein BGZ98_004663 [Dissophora globulifera]